MVTSRVTRAVVIATAVLVCISCSGGGSGVDSGAVTFRGNFSNSVTAHGLGSAITTIGAIEVVGGGVSIEAIENMPEAPVDENENFDISVPQEEDSSYVLMTLDEGVQGFVAFPASDDDSLVAFPTAGAAGTVDAGTLSALLGDEYAADLDPLETADLSGLSLEDLYLLARMDDAAKTARNLYNTYDPETGEYFNVQKSTLINNSFETIRNRFSTPGTYDEITQQLNVTVFNPAQYTYGDISGGSVVVKVYPSIDTYYGGDSWGTGELFGPDNPFSTDEPTNLAHWFSSSDLGGDGSYGFSFSINGEMPPEWRFTYDDVDRATIYVDFLDLFIESGSDEYYKYFFPSLNATTDTSGLISRIETRFYLYDTTTGAYEEVDLAALDEYGGFSVSFNREYENPPDSGQYTSENETIDGAAVITDFDIDWIFEDATTGYAFISVNTALGEMPFSFYFNREDG